MVFVGDTVFEVVPKTEPILLSIVKVSAVPPDSVRDSVTDFPDVIEEGVATNVLITGADKGVLVTIEVTASGLAIVELGW